MKKTAHIYLNILISFVLCTAWSDIPAVNEVYLFQKNSICQYESIEKITTNSPSFDIRSKKKKTKTQRKSSGKITFDSFRQYYDKALKYYDNKAYLSAARIFEELYPLSIGTPLGDTILFLFADSYFQNHDYQMASFHFRDYAKRYPGTEKAELASLNAVKAMYYTSPDYNLDQYVTNFAIDEINLFIQQYPYSKYIQDCNDMLDDLRNKLAKKDMEIVRMYYQTGYYEAAQIMARNFLKTYSSSKYAPEVLLILIKNNYDYARKSVEQKKYYRYKDCMDAYDMLQSQYPENSYLAEGKKIAGDAENQIKKLDERKK